MCGVGRSGFPWGRAALRNQTACKATVLQCTVDVMQEFDDSADRSSRLLRGILDACMLALIVERDRYGYEIAAKMREVGLDFVRDGTIYPLLSRLERRGHLTSYIAPSVRGGPKRRYYRITPAGRHELHNATATWDYVSRGVNGVLGIIDQPGGNQ